MKVTLRPRWPHQGGHRPAGMVRVRRPKARVGPNQAQASRRLDGPRPRWPPVRTGGLRARRPRGERVGHVRLSERGTGAWARAVLPPRERPSDAALPREGRHESRAPWRHEARSLLWRRFAECSGRQGSALCDRSAVSGHQRLPEAEEQRRGLAHGRAMPSTIASWLRCGRGEAQTNWPCPRRRGEAGPAGRRGPAAASSNVRGSWAYDSAIPCCSAVVTKMFCHHLDRLA